MPYAESFACMMRIQRSAGDLWTSCGLQASRTHTLRVNMIKKLHALLKSVCICTYRKGIDTHQYGYTVTPYLDYDGEYLSRRGPSPPMTPRSLLVSRLMTLSSIHSTNWALDSKRSCSRSHKAIARGSNEGVTRRPRTSHSVSTCSRNLTRLCPWHTPLQLLPRS